jgi:hypothetical protein
MCSSLNILGRPKEGERSQEPFFSGQLSRTGHFTQIPSGKADECNGDVSPTEETQFRSDSITIACCPTNLMVWLRPSGRRVPFFGGIYRRLAVIRQN